MNPPFHFRKKKHFFGWDPLGRFTIKSNDSSISSVKSKKLDHMVTSCEAGMPLTATPLNKKLWSLPTPNRPLFANSRKGQQWRESQPTPTPLHARRCLKGDLCERREEFNEVRGEYRSATTSANAYVNASLKSLLGARYQLDGPWAINFFFW